MKRSELLVIWLKLLFARILLNQAPAKKKPLVVVNVVERLKMDAILKLLRGNEESNKNLLSSLEGAASQFCVDCNAPVSQSDDEDEVSAEVRSTELRIISNTLKEIIGNIEPPKPKNTATINLVYCIYKVVEDVAKSSGMKVMAQEKSWDVVWYSRGVKSSRCAMLVKGQRINYFPESDRTVKKNNFAMFLTKMWNVYPEEYDFFPKSWSLPRDWHLMEKHSRRHPKDWFIVKPNNSGGGYGIYLSNETTKLSNCGKMTSQVYIRNPLLIDGLKFDLRIYVLVTSCKPMRIFVYNEGLARFATEKYQEPDHENKSNRFIHLTNYAVNKYSPKYTIDENTGTLRRWSTVSKCLSDYKIDAKRLSASMDDTIIKTLIAMAPTINHHYFKSFPHETNSNSCFQIFGFDIMFDEDLKVYVLEVNGSPQLSADVQLDIEMTENLIRDTFNIVNLAEKPDAPQECQPTSKNFWFVRQNENRALTRRRTEWEDSHLGNFRKIYPTTRNKCYKKLIKAAEQFIHPL